MNYVCEKVAQNIAQIRKKNIAKERSLLFVNPFTKNIRNTFCIAGNAHKTIQDLNLAKFLFNFIPSLQSWMSYGLGGEWKVITEILF